MNATMNLFSMAATADQASTACKAEAYVNSQADNPVADVKAVLSDGCALVADLLNGQDDAAVSQDMKRALAGQVLEKMQRIAGDVTTSSGQIYPCFTC